MRSFVLVSLLLSTSACTAILGGREASGGICTIDSAACTTPPANVCTNASTLQTFVPDGTCAEDRCVYSSTEVACENGCANGACLAPSSCPDASCNDVVQHDTWATVAALPDTCITPGAALGPDGRIYNVAGWNAHAVTTVEAYTLGNNSWAAVASLSTARGFLAVVGGQALLDATGTDSRIFAIGGYDGGSDFATVEAYTASSNSWATMTPMPTARGRVAGALGSDGQIYVLGGLAGGTPIANAEVYAPSTNSWATITPMPTARMGLAAAADLDGKIYAIGGNNGSILSTVEVYTPSSDSWKTVAPLPTARYALAAVLGSDGRIYVIGGADASVALSVVEAYTPSTDSWETVAPMPTPRYWIAATAGPDGRIYAIGGQNGDIAYANVEAYTP